MNFYWKNDDVIEALQKVKNSEWSVEQANTFFETEYKRTLSKATIYRQLLNTKSGAKHTIEKLKMKK